MANLEQHAHHISILNHNISKYTINNPENYNQNIIIHITSMNHHFQSLREKCVTITKEGEIIN